MGWQELTTKEWDCIVVGTGMGGSVLGLMLARAGWRILFIERGRHYLQDAESLRGNYAETFFHPSDFPQEKHAELLSRAGRSGEPLVISTEPRPYQHIPFIGCGTGGSTALYGMALERFFPSDFKPAAAHPSSAVKLPEEWPFSYEDLEPYYRRAERLFGASGTVDPLRPSTDAPVLGDPTGLEAHCRSWRFATSSPSTCTRIGSRWRAATCPAARSVRVALLPRGLQARCGHGGVGARDHRARRRTAGPMHGHQAPSHGRPRRACRL